MRTEDSQKQLLALKNTMRTVHNSNEPTQNIDSKVSSKNTIQTEVKVDLNNISLTDSMPRKTAPQRPKPDKPVGELSAVKVGNKKNKRKVPPTLYERKLLNATENKKDALNDFIVSAKTMYAQYIPSATKKKNINKDNKKSYTTQAKTEIDAVLGKLKTLMNDIPSEKEKQHSYAKFTKSKSDLLNPVIKAIDTALDNLKKTIGFSEGNTVNIDLTKIRNTLKTLGDFIQPFAIKSLYQKNNAVKQPNRHTVKFDLSQIYRHANSATQSIKHLFNTENTDQQKNDESFYTLLKKFLPQIEKTTLLTCMHKMRDVAETLIRASVVTTVNLQKNNEPPVITIEFPTDEESIISPKNIFKAFGVIAAITALSLVTDFTWWYAITKDLTKSASAWAPVLKGITAIGTAIAKLFVAKISSGAALAIGLSVILIGVVVLGLLARHFYRKYIKNQTKKNLTSIIVLPIVKKTPTNNSDDNHANE